MTGPCLCGDPACVRCGAPDPDDRLYLYADHCGHPEPPRQPEELDREWTDADTDRFDRWADDHPASVQGPKICLLTPYDPDEDTGGAA